jgi:hypothetical protein
MNNANGQSGHERCGGRTRAGTPCKLPAGHGTGHPGVGRCDHHGGATPTHRAHAERVLLERAEGAALAKLHRIGAEPIGNPLETLAELAGEARQWQAILRPPGGRSGVAVTYDSRRGRAGPPGRDLV